MAVFVRLGPLVGAGLIAVGIGMPATSATAQTFDDVHRCDELAAHPDDPGRWANGVYDDAIVPGPAIKFCSEAAEAYPDSPRFHFQYARALWAGNRHDEAIEALLRAEEHEYGPAYAYLGDAYFDGLGGIKQDEEFAITLYQMAAEAGFTPAEIVLEDIASLTGDEQVSAEMEAVAPEASTEPAPTATEGDQQTLIEKIRRWQSDPKVVNAEKFNPEAFSKGRRLLQIYNGDFETLAANDQTFQMVYFIKMNEYFAQTINFHSEACSGYFDPDLAPGMMRDIMGAISGGDGGLSDQGLQILKGIADLATGGPGALINRMTYIEAEQNAGTKDGVMLARSYGCDNPVFKRLYKNMLNYVRGYEPAEASGWPGLRLACQRYAIEMSGTPSDVKSRCTCIVEQFVDAGVPMEVSEWLQANYDHAENFGATIAQYDGLRKKVGACLL